MALLLSFSLAFAIDAAVNFVLAVGQLENVRQLLLGGGNAARVFAFDDVGDVFGQLWVIFFHAFAVFDNINGNIGVDIAQSV